MSVPRFSEEERREQTRFSLAMKILGEVAPRILSMNTPLTVRVAEAYSWFQLLKNIAPAICNAYCGPEFNENYREWGEGELEKISQALVAYASRILSSILGREARERIVPKPPL